MSLLDRGDQYEPCIVYPETVREDEDGNKITYPSPTGIPAMGRFQIQGQSGTASRRAEQEDEGFTSERVYTVHFTRAFDAEHGELCAQSDIVWGVDSQGRPARYQIFGDVQKYGSSRRTRHNVYTIRRA